MSSWHALVGKKDTGPNVVSLVVGVGVAGVVSMTGLVVFGTAGAGLVIEPSLSSSAGVGLVVGLVVGAVMAGNTVGKEESKVGVITGD